MFFIILMASLLSTSHSQLSVLGKQLTICGLNPRTGFFRDGLCVTGPSDTGRHVVAAVLTAEFLAFTKSRGNDLSTPHPPHFPGLNPGDRWCLCAARWLEAYEAGVAPPVDLAATNVAALKIVPLSALQEHALPSEEGVGPGGDVDSTGKKGGGHT